MRTCAIVSKPQMNADMKTPDPKGHRAPNPIVPRNVLPCVPAAEPSYSSAGGTHGSTPAFKRILGTRSGGGLDVPLEQFQRWKWALLKRGWTWEQFLLHAGDLVVRETVQQRIAQGRSVPQGIAERVAESRQPIADGQ